MKKTFILVLLLLSIVYAASAEDGYMRLTMKRGNVNLRLEPRYAGEILAQAKEGDVFIAEKWPIVCNGDKSEWYRIVLAIDASANKFSTLPEWEPRIETNIAYITNAGFIAVSPLAEDDMEKIMATQLGDWPALDTDPLTGKFSATADEGFRLFSAKRTILKDTDVYDRDFINRNGSKAAGHFKAGNEVHLIGTNSDETIYLVHGPNFNPLFGWIAADSVEKIGTNHDPIDFYDFIMLYRIFIGTDIGDIVRKWGDFEVERYAEEWIYGEFFTFAHLEAQDMAIEFFQYPSSSGYTLQEFTTERKGAGFGGIYIGVDWCDKNWVKALLGEPHEIDDNIWHWSDEYNYLLVGFDENGLVSSIEIHCEVSDSDDGVDDADIEDAKTIKVSNSREFLEALDSNRVILMAPGRYNLSEWDPYLSNKDALKLAEGLSWEDILNEGELHLEGIVNLTIRGVGPEGDRAEIIVDPRHVYVMSFENCSGIAIEGVSAGHSVGGYCEGGVFSFTDSSRTTITNTGMYGCGTEGLALANVSDMKVTDSEIHECTYYIMTVTSGKDIAFVNCVFRDNQELTLINVSGTENMSLSNCHFNNNRGQVFDVENTTISVLNSSFNSNNTDSPIQSSRNVEFYSCIFDATGIGRYTYDYDEQTEEYNWTLKGEALEVTDTIYGMSEGQNVRWIAISPKIMARMKGSQSGVIFYVMRDGNYYFLPFERAHQIRKVNFTDEDKHINVIWADEGGNFNEEGFTFPNLKEQGIVSMADLFKLSKSGKLRVVEAAIKTGVNVNAKDSYDRTVLMIAQSNEDLKDTSIIEELK
jgi:hypothetical protein